MYAEDIQYLDERSILQPEVFIELLDTESEILKEELESALLERAKVLGVKTAFNKRLKAYKKDIKKMNEPTTVIQTNQLRCSFELKLTSKGAVANCLDNYVTILRNDNKYANRLLFNELKQGYEYVEDSGIKREWSDVDDSKTRHYIEKQYGIYGDRKLDDALNIIFEENSYHPVKELIESLVWDGVSRIETLLTRWLKAPDDDYTKEVSRLIFAGGMNRLYEPGCKFDEMPVLIGKRQGEGKSTFVSWLALDDEYFREIKEIEGQKGVEALEGGWVCEMGELLALTKAKEVEAVKAYITCRADHGRKAYARRVVTVKRQCIFIGTTNKEQFLTDKTGNRRFYPVICESRGYQLFERKEEIQYEIRQCWAEAKVLYDKGQLPAYAKIELLDQIRMRQEEAVEDDYREGMVEAYLKKKDVICIIELWQKALGNLYTKPTRKESNEIATMLNKHQGWVKEEKVRPFDDYGNQRSWMKITNMTTSNQLVTNQLSPQSIEK